MEKTTVAALIKELRKPGRVEMPVLAEHDVFHIVVEKHDLIDQLRKLKPEDMAPWSLHGDGSDNGGVRRLDVQHEKD